VGQVLFYPTAMGHPGEKEQYGENQYGAWMNIERTCGSKWVYVAAANRIGSNIYLIQQG
jgi:N-carbamoylputrescine amidase